MTILLVFLGFSTDTNHLHVANNVFLSADFATNLVLNEVYCPMTSFNQPIERDRKIDN